MAEPRASGPPPPPPHAHLAPLTPPSRHPRHSRHSRRLLVIPAKAGIHRVGTPQIKTWIPAYAGMTKKQRSSSINIPHYTLVIPATPSSFPLHLRHSHHTFVIPAQAGIHRVRHAAN